VLTKVKLAAYIAVACIATHASHLTLTFAESYSQFGVKVIHKKILFLLAKMRLSHR